MTRYAVYLDCGRSILMDKESWMAVQEAMAYRHPIVTIKYGRATYVVDPSHIVTAVKLEERKP